MVPSFMIMTDASDAYVLTVFPFGEGDEIPEDYEVGDWPLAGSWLTVHDS